jgi:transposase
MPKTRPPYRLEFGQRLIELVRKGADARELARQFESSAQAIRNRVRQADRDDGHRQDGLKTVEPDELPQLRRENKTLREERGIPQNTAALFARETGSMTSGFEYVRAHQAVHDVATMCRVAWFLPPAATMRGVAGRCRPEPVPTCGHRQI